MLTLKCSGIAKTLNDSAKVVLCLDISCELINISFNGSAGIKLAGLKKTSYKNNRNNLIKLLNLNKKLGIPEMTLKLGITSNNVEKTAMKILETYKKESFEDTDLDHPQFVVMSIFQATKIEKVKATKTNFITASNLKPNQWNLLEKTWDKWTVNVGKSNKENVKSAAAEESAGKDEKVLKRKQTAEPDIEDYDVWAKKTLEQAYIDLAKKSKSLAI